MLKTLLLLLQRFLCSRNSATRTFCLRQDSYLAARHFLYKLLEMLKGSLGGCSEAGLCNILAWRRPSNREVRAQSPSASSTGAHRRSTDVVLLMHAAGCPLEGYLLCTHCTPDLESRRLMPCDSCTAHPRAPVRPTARAPAQRRSVARP
ncbi:hypothetical protein B0H14DRAFT_3016131 [Mycena olivaceomarginata]|nr:hypothetical protein B0H14DRAFT_3016131 [Mycena olivaceomarginata]